MVLKPDQQRVCSMLKDTITLLCKNGLAFKNKFSIEAVIGVTLDDESMFHISMSEIVKSPLADDDESDVSQNGETNSVQRKRKKKAKVKQEKGSQDESSDGSDRSDDNEPVDDDTSSLTSDRVSQAKIPKIKGEPESGEEDDLVFVKQEIDENWSQNTSAYMSQSQNPNYPSLSDVTLVPLGQGNMNSGQWSQSHRQQYSTPRMQRTSTVTMGEGGATPSQVDSSQSGQDQSSSAAPVFTCEKCGKVYHRKASLKDHMMVHLGLYRYNCEICDRGFTASKNYKAHMLEHAGLQPYRCDTCDRAFCYKDSLTRHVMVKHNIPI